MKIYTIVAGVNGVGKSSLSGVLKAERSDLGHIIDVYRIAAENGFGPNENGFAQVAEYKNGDLGGTAEAGKRPEWLKELMDKVKQIYC